MSNVAHPSHYNIPGKRECIVALREDYGMMAAVMYCLTSAYKYLYRAGAKDGASYEEDIAKAKFLYDYASKLLTEDDTYFMDSLKLFRDVRKGLDECLQ